MRHPLAAHELRAVAICDALAAASSAVPGDGPPTEAVAFQALACAELTRVQGKRDPARWRAGAERFRAIGLLYPAAYADLHAAEALALSGAARAEVAAPLSSRRHLYSNRLRLTDPPGYPDHLEPDLRWAFLRKADHAEGFLTAQGFRLVHRGDFLEIYRRDDPESRP